MTWQVVIPWIGPAPVLDRCLSSMRKHECPDVPVLVVDNAATTPHRAVNPGLIGVEVARQPCNIGVAASWNLGLARGAERTLVLSASMTFAQGLEHTLGLLEVAASDQPGSAWGIRTDHAWHAHVVGRRCAERCGWFDERFMPKEYEDTDYVRRMTLEGMHWDYVIPKAGKAGMTCAGDSLASKAGLVPRSDAPREHYIAKWGGDPGSETSEVPLV